jgi:hypothetical protein
MGLSWFPGAQANLNDGLVLHLEFEGNAQDSSSSANHGTENDVEYVAGKNGQAISFNGEGAFIKIPDTDSLDTDHVMTIATWINPNSVTDPDRTNAIFASKWHTADSSSGIYEGDWMLEWYGKTDDSVTFGVANYPEFGSENGLLSVTGGIVPKNSWHHLVAIFDNGQIKTYLNGVLIHEETSVIKYTAKNKYPNDDIFLGQTWSGSYAYKGLLDDFRLYNRALSESEIQQLHPIDTPPVDNPAEPPKPPTNDCWAIYEDGNLHIPCIKVIVPLDKAELRYEADMQYEPSSDPMKFKITGATQKTAEPPTKDCWAIYENNNLHIPCIKVIGPFADELHYEVDMQYEPSSDPMKFKITGATQK